MKRFIKPFWKYTNDDWGIFLSAAIIFVLLLFAIFGGFSNDSEENNFENGNSAGGMWGSPAPTPAFAPDWGESGSEESQPLEPVSTPEEE